MVEVKTEIEVAVRVSLLFGGATSATDACPKSGHTIRSSKCPLSNPQTTKISHNPTGPFTVVKFKLPPKKGIVKQCRNKS